MKLITPEFEELMKEYPLYSQEEKDDPVVQAKFFDPCGAASWWITEYNPETKIAFGFVTGLHEDEFGYVSLEEMEAIERPFGLTIERDLYFTPKPLSACINKNGASDD